MTNFYQGPAIVPKYERVQDLSADFDGSNNLRHHPNPSAATAFANAVLYHRTPIIDRQIYNASHEATQGTKRTIDPLDRTIQTGAVDMQPSISSTARKI